MKILFILKQEADDTIRAMMTEAAKESEVKVVDLREDHDYDALVESIENCDRVITW